MTISRLTDLVAIRLGEYPCRRSATGETAVSLESMVAAAAEEVAVSLTLAAPVTSLTSTVDFRTHLTSNLRSEPGGYATLPMPADFLRLHSLRMKGWPMLLPEGDTPAGVNPLRQALGPSAPDWMSVRPTLPWLECEWHLDPDSDSARALLRLAPVETPVAERALYVPRPYVDEDSAQLLRLDASLVEGLVERLCEIFNNI